MPQSPKPTTARAKHTRPSICRLCIAHCGILATVEAGKLTHVSGDPDNPLFKGYTCPKGRALPELHNHPERLLCSQKRNAGLQENLWVKSSPARAEILRKAG